MRPRIALMTIFQVPNYGSVLQAYATQTVITKLGYDCDLINYNYPNDWHYRHGFLKQPIWRKIIKNIANISGLHKQVLANSIQIFRKKYLNLTHSFPDLDSLKNNDWTRYSALVAGSDQLWNPIYLKGDSAFMLSFSNKLPKISIASSFAVTEIAENLLSKYKENLTTFSAISIREQNGAKIIESQLSLKIHPKVLLDPTLLLSDSEWYDSLKISADAPKERYILMYILSYAFNPYPDAVEIARELKYKYQCSKIITFSPNNSPEVNELGAESIYGCPVEDFLYYIRHAYIIVTSSFHGTAFALNFGRPLISITPSNGDDRQTTLLRMLNLEQCGAIVGTDHALLTPMYDVADEQRKLNEIRNDDISWISYSLKTAINSNQTCNS